MNDAAEEIIQLFCNPMRLQFSYHMESLGKSVLRLFFSDAQFIAYNFSCFHA